MKGPSSEFKERKEKAFITFCSKALRRERIDYWEQKSKTGQREIAFSQLTEDETNLLQWHEKKGWVLVYKECRVEN